MTYNFTLIAQVPEFILKDSGVDEVLTATAVINIVADKESTYIPPPRFQKALYRGNISDTGIFSYEPPTIDEESYSEDLSFTLSGDDGDLFSVELVHESTHSLNVLLKSPITEENVNGKTFLTATISANHPEVFSGSTVLLIDLPIVPEITTPKPIFEKSLIKGSIDTDLQLFIETIVLLESTYTADTIFSMAGGMNFYCLTCVIVV